MEGKGDEDMVERENCDTRFIKQANVCAPPPLLCTYPPAPSPPVVVLGVAVFVTVQGLVLAHPLPLPRLEEREKGEGK